MKRLIGPIMALLFFASTTTALAPSKPQEITTFEPVTVDSLDIDHTWLYPSPSMGGRPTPKIVEPSPLIKDLTTPKPAVYNPTVADAKRYALDRLGSVQFSCIDKIFTRESNWRTTATNSTSGAYGIPQALPGSKMATMGDDWRTNPVTQVKWGIRYVNIRYGSACDAWRFMQSNGWY